MLYCAVLWFCSIGFWPFSDTLGHSWSAEPVEPFRVCTAECIRTNWKKKLNKIETPVDLQFFFFFQPSSHIFRDTSLIDLFFFFIELLFLFFIASFFDRCQLPSELWRGDTATTTTTMDIAVCRRRLLPSTAVTSPIVLPPHPFTKAAFRRAVHPTGESQEEEEAEG